MLFWLLLVALLPNDRATRLAAAVGCGVYVVLTLSESAPVTPAPSVPVTAQEVA